jgi:hypothetical protein
MEVSWFAPIAFIEEFDDTLEFLFRNPASREKALYELGIRSAEDAIPDIVQNVYLGRSFAPERRIVEFPIFNPVLKPAVSLEPPHLNLDSGPLELVFAVSINSFENLVYRHFAFLPNQFHDHQVGV